MSAEFEAFFTTFERPIFGYLWHLTGDEQAAQDLAQETFLRAWDHFSAISSHRDNGAWLFRVASNLALSYRRRRAHPVGAAMPIDTFDFAHSDPTGRVVEAEMVHHILMELPDRQRAVLILREVYGFQGQEMAEILNCSLDAVKMALWRARVQFRLHYLREDAP